MKKIICAIAIAALLPSVAVAGRPPSDIELRAAYCLGRLDHPALEPQKYPQEMHKDIEASNSAAAIARRRLQIYLEPKSYLDTDALLMAAARGKEAQAKTADACMENSKSSECAYLTKDQSGCRNPSFLPF